MAALLACRTCLSTNAKLHNIHELNLTEPLLTSVGVLVRADDSLPQHICAFCRTLLVKYGDFRSRCDQAQQLLNSSLATSYYLTTDSVKQISDSTTNLKLQYQIKTIILDSTRSLATINEYKLIDTDDNKYKIELIESVDESTDLKGELLDMQVEESFNSDPEWDNRSISSESCKSDEFLNVIVQKKKRGKYKKDGGKKAHRKLYPEHVVLENGIKKRYSNKLEEDANTIHFNIKMDLNNVEIKKLSHEEQVSEFEARKSCKLYNESKLKCDYCYKGFRKLDTYKNHMLQHDPVSGDFVCDLCKIRLRTARKHRLHFRSAHEMKYSCKICGYATSNRCLAIEHQDRHKGLEYPCSDCGKVIKKLSNYLSHIRLHQEGEHLCSACGKKFLKENGLLMHLRKVHHNLKFKSFVISNEVETRTASYIQDRPEPKKRRRRTKEEIEMEKDGKSEGDRKSKGNESVVCETCGSKHRCLAMLRIHQRTHTGEKPHKCDVCERSFVAPSQLWVHKRTHTKERPYRCIVCEKCFAAKVNLNRHMLVHTGDKPHACNICGKAFSQSNSMKLHIQTVHLKQPWPYKRKRKTPGTNAAMDTEQAILD